MPSNYSENHNQTFGSNGDDDTSEAASLIPNGSNPNERNGNYRGFNGSLDLDINTIGLQNVSIFIWIR